MKDKQRILMMGLTPPLTGGSQRHIYEISSRIANSRVLTQKGTICKNNIEIRVPENPVWLRNIMFALLVRFYVVYLLLTIKKKYDVIHIHENLLYPCAIPLSWRYKVIVTVHGIKGFKFYENKFLWFFFKLGLKSADKIICVDLVEKEMLGKEGFRKVVHVPNGANIEIYNGLKAKVGKKISFVGRIHEQKGMKYLLEAFEKVSKKHPDYKLEIIGEINDYARELQKQFPNKNVIWKGFILDRKRLFSEILSSEILVYPSLWEALPWPALLEGLASGRAVVASNLPGMSRIFNDNENILLSEPRNNGELAELICMLIEQKEKATRIGLEGKELAKNYSWDRIAKEVAKVYLK